MWDDGPSRSDIFTVSAITLEIKELLETQLPTVWVEGEISNFSRHSSGHLYFSLKDESAQLACVMWRMRAGALFFLPRDGLRVRALGSIRVYEKRGTYQLDIARLIPAGFGELQAAFEALKLKLKDEGLFDPLHKKPIPPFPERIGIITSPTGAALRDIQQILNRRMPFVQKILRPTLVQGESAVQDIVNAIEEMNEFGAVDVIILGRGGGTLEDLWAFNEEAVARAVYASRVPIISAVGHEIDFTICDLVADLRAPTPSAAAEIAVKNSVDVAQELNELILSCRRTIDSCLSNYRKTLRSMEQSYSFRRSADVVRQRQQRLDELSRAITSYCLHKFKFQNEKMIQLRKRFSSLHPQAVLERGFALVWHKRLSQFMKTTDDACVDDDLDIHLGKGSLAARITKIVKLDVKWRDAFDEPNH
ncbi:MAG: exodeoxyribonuclease VII large subunit [Calditrichaeota bacterium]|nr:MAG: exodeoxyribonuclease VII large subunit [Calditrichota bacterium]